jgi:hypothetical protein
MVHNLMVHYKKARPVLFSILYTGATLLTSGLAKAQQAGPVIDSVTMHEDDGGRYPVVYPEFHFHDPSGTTRFIHREVVSTDAPKPMAVQDGTIDISANQQMRGATYVGGWHCGPETYYVTLRAFMVNLAGSKSNIVEYTIHCNGG